MSCHELLWHVLYAIFFSIRLTMHSHFISTCFYRNPNATQFFLFRNDQVRAVAFITKNVIVPHNLFLSANYRNTRLEHLQPAANKRPFHFLHNITLYLQYSFPINHPWTLKSFLFKCLKHPRGRNIRTVCLFCGGKKHLNIQQAGTEKKSKVRNQKRFLPTMVFSSQHILKSMHL